MATAIQKHLGAFYTSTPVARALVAWALRKRDDNLLDPSCGEGVFLQAGAERLSRMRGEPSAQIFGIDIDPVAADKLWFQLKTVGIRWENIRVSDFFDVKPSSLPKFKAIVGNPPFIRYQTFKGASREKALEIARSLGVSISELTSSWAPFLLNATRFLAPGGRLAMVVPAEISHASYARPVLRYLVHRFRRIIIASFAERLFPDLNQDTYLFFAEHFGGACKTLRVRKFHSVRDLASGIEPTDRTDMKVSSAQISNGNGRLRNHFLPKETAELYTLLAANSHVCRLGELADVGIGYVTGANDFFHFTQEELDKYDIPRRYIKKTILRSGIAKGLRLTRDDWEELRGGGEKVYLLAIPRSPKQLLPKSVLKYLERGFKAEVHKAYKCTVRRPWYSVPISDPADSFLTYMSGEAPRIVWNEPRLLATNSLHEVRLHSSNPDTAWKVGLALCSSLSQLSSEIEGHPLGGGMLKLEPSEAESVLIMRPDILRFSQTHFEELDSLIRAGAFKSAVDVADELLLRGTLGLTWEQIRALRFGLDEIRESRRKKIAPSRSD